MSVTGKEPQASSSEEGPDASAQSVSDSLLSRIEEVVVTMRDRILDEEPAYRRLAPAELADVTELLRRNARTLSLAVAGHRVTHQELAYQGDHVHRRVHTGISLETVLQAYRTAMNGFWEECTAEVVSRKLSRDVAIDLARKTSEAMDMLTTRAAAIYVREESRLRALGEQASRDLIDAILRGDIDGERAEPFSAAPGLDPQSDLIVVVGRVSTDGGALGAALETAATALADALATPRASPLLVVRERAIVAIIAADSRERHSGQLNATRAALEDRHAIRLYCGISSPCVGFTNAAAAYEQAALAVSRASDRQPIVSLAALPALQHLMIGATGTTRALLLEKARVIADQGEEAVVVMRTTLHGYAAADMNVSRAAAELHVHENTLRYRLRRIHQQTGNDPRRFEGLVELICLLEALEG